MDLIRHISSICKKYSVLLAVALIACCATTSFAQTTSAPVQVNSQLTPPYSIYLSDYTNDLLNKWPITLSLRDFTKSDYRVRLRITIESQTVRFRTKPSFMPQGMYLNPGVPTQVTYDKLAAYLNPNNMEMSGINPATFASSQQLPEGFYTFTIEVLDYQRGNVVSNTSRNIAWIVQNDPPLLNLPFEEKVRIQDPQQIQFQWTPRHTSSPNSAFETEYIFRLWEIWPAGRNPFEVVRTSNPVFEQRTNLNSYFYGPGDIPLIPGRSYAWQVQAVSNIGRDLFKNNGRSEVKSFQYGDECLTVTGVGLEALGPDRIKVDWTGDWNHSGYVVEVREKGTTDWTTYATNIETQVVFDLEAGTEYEVQVKSNCGVLTGIASDILSVQTLDASEVDFECGADPNNPAITNRDPIESLQIGDRIEALGFKVRITEITGAGPYNGKGAIEVPLFNLASVEADLVNIEVNTDKKLIGGYVETTLNPAGPFIVGLDSDELDEGEEEDDSTDVETDSTQNDNVDIQIDNDIDTVYTNDDREIVVVDSDGNEEVYTQEDLDDANEDGVIVLQDEDGDNWTVDENGNVTEGGGSQSGGGSSDNSSDDSSDQEDVVIPDNALIFGPIQVVFADSLRSSGQDADGYCSFDSLAASFEFELVDTDIDISKEISIEGATVSFKKECNGDGYKEVSINWSKSDGKDIGNLGFIGAKIYSVELSVNGSGEISGSVDLEPYLSEDKQLNDLVVVKAGVAGRFSYSFSGSDSFDGDFDFTSVTGINIQMKKDNRVFASLDDGSFNDQKQVEGTVRLGGEPFTYTSNNFTVKLKSFETDIKVDPGENIYFSEGIGEIEISNITGINGKLVAGLEMTNNQWITTVESNTLSGYGLTFKNLNITSVVNNDLSIEKIHGNFKASHPSLSTDLNINGFLIEQGELQEFNASGNFDYNGFSIDLTSSQYIPDSTTLLLNATARVETDGVAVAASVDNFYIDSEGNISMGNIDVSVDGTITFGPVSIALQGEAIREGNASGWGYKRYNATASMYLNVKDNTGFEKEQPITELSIGFDKHQSNSEYRNINIVFSDEGGLDFANIYGLQASLNEVRLDISPKENVDFLTGTSSDADNIAISSESYVALSAGVSEDITIRDVFVLKSGAGGNIRYNFNGGTNLEGTFDYSDISNINISIQKGDKQLAGLTNGNLNQDGVLSGTLSALDNATFNSNSFEVAVNDLTMDFDYDIAAGANGFTINNGNADLSVQNINGVEGSVNLQLSYGVDGNFNASVDNENTTLSAFSMDISDFNVNVDMDQSFNITKIDGAVSAKHSSFDSNLTISEFEIENGTLTKFKGEGDVLYNGFDLEILETSYVNSELSITGKMNINLTGASVKAEVREFKIRDNGSVVVKEVSSNLNKSPLEIGFSAGFDDNRFHGSFTGSMLSVGLEGELDIGKQMDFYFAYLMLTGKTDIPLGPSGLKLTQFGGQLGYNYSLQYNSSQSKFIGSPQDNNYIIGLKLGVADVANLFEVTGNPIVQFGGNEIDISLIGTVSAPRYNPVFTADLNANYKMPSNVVSGDISTELKIPSSTGKVFKGNFAVDFYAGNNEWSVHSSNISASILEEVNFTGGVDLEGQFTTGSFTGTLAGNASYDYTKNYNFEAFGASLYANLNAGFNFNGNIQVLESGFSGNLYVRIYANGTLGINTSVYDGSISVQSDCEAEVSYANNQGRLRGTLHTSVDLYFFEETVDVSVDQTF